MKRLIDYIKESKQSTVYVMIGIPGSGKSTWAKNNHPNLEVVSRDIIRAKLGYTKNSDEKAVLSPDQEAKVSKVEYETIDELCNNNKSFIIDDTNTGKYRKQLISKLRNYGVKIVGVNINTPLETCIKRRNGQIPEDVMRKLYTNKIDIKPEEVDEIINVNN